MVTYSEIVEKKEKISLVGLGYVGMPIAIEFAKRGVQVVGFDLNAAKIETYKSGIDPTNEVGDDVIKETTVEFTSDEKHNIMKLINNFREEKEIVSRLHDYEII